MADASPVDSRACPRVWPTTLVVNPNAGSHADAADILARRAKQFGWRMYETRSTGDGTRLAERAVLDGQRRVVVAGGDGTVSEVVQGLLESGGDAALGVMPLGTGNDFARSVGMPADLGEACDWLADPRLQARRVDVLRVRSGDARRHAINCVTGGLSRSVDDHLDVDTKRRWGPLSFAVAGLQLLGHIPQWDIELTVDDGPTEHVSSALGVCFANARYAGGGWLLAPTADMEDGLLDVVTITTGDMLSLGDVAFRARLGGLLESGQVTHRMGRKVRIRAPKDFRFNADGEPFDGRELTVEVLPGRVSLLPGPDYTTDPLAS